MHHVAKNNGGFSPLSWFYFTKEKQFGRELGDLLRIVPVSGKQRMGNPT